MRVFVLCTGRCGSMTFAEACRHMTNYTSGHETRYRRYGDDRLDYADNHIEVDNRLSWLLGELDERFGSEPFYVHLRRDSEAVARSFHKRWNRGILKVFSTKILGLPKWGGQIDRMEVCRHYVRTVESNIRLFLRDKPAQMTIDIEEAEHLFPQFWEQIEAEGDLPSAVKELSVCHNAS